MCADPVDIHTYYVVHVDGVYIVTLSWLSKLDMFTAADRKSMSSCLKDITDMVQYHIEKRH